MCVNGEYLAAELIDPRLVIRSNGPMVVNSVPMPIKGGPKADQVQSRLTKSGARLVTRLASSCGDVEMWRCGDVEIWRYGDVGMWGC